MLFMNVISRYFIFISLSLEGTVYMSFFSNLFSVE